MCPTRISGRWRISRIVTLPDYQGIGIGMAATEAVAEVHRAYIEAGAQVIVHPSDAIMDGVAVAER